MSEFLGSFAAFTVLNGLVLGSAFLWSKRSLIDGSFLDRVLSIWVLFMAQIVFSEIALGVVGQLSLLGLYLFHGVMLGVTLVYVRFRSSE